MPREGDRQEAFLKIYYLPPPAIQFSILIGYLFNGSKFFFGLCFRATVSNDQAHIEESLLAILVDWWDAKNPT